RRLRHPPGGPADTGLPALLLPDIAACQQQVAHQVAGAGDHPGRRVPGRLWLAHDALRARARDLHRRAGPGVATGTFINRNHLAGYLEMCLAAGVGLMLAELSSSRAASWRDSARHLLRTLLGNKARVRLALVVMVTGLVLTRSRMGNTAFFASLTSVGCF